MADEKQKLQDMYKMMLRIRRFEEKAGHAVAEGTMPGFVHLSIGQEAVAAGVMHDLRKDDFISSTHRGHGELIAKGMAPREMFAELLGKATGVCGGRGGESGRWNHRNLFCLRPRRLARRTHCDLACSTAAQGVAVARAGQIPQASRGSGVDGHIRGSTVEGARLRCLPPLPVDRGVGVYAPSCAPRCANLSCRPFGFSPPSPQVGNVQGREDCRSIVNGAEESGSGPSRHFPENRDISQQARYPAGEGLHC